MIDKLRSEALEIIDAYRNMPLGGQLVRCPYFKNRLGVRLGLKVYLGKGSAADIVKEVNIIARKENIDLKSLGQTEIRGFMERHNLGIDCSGFIAQTLWSVNPELVRKIAHKRLFPNIYRALASRLRPIENISIAHLTSTEHSRRLESIQEVQAGDIIRSRQGRHGMLVTEVRRAETGQLKEIAYAHSTSYYGGEHGVRTGQIKVIYANEPLQDQDWQEKDSQGRSYTHEGFGEDDGTNGIYRLKSL